MTSLVRRRVRAAVGLLVLGSVLALGACGVDDTFVPKTPPPPEVSGGAAPVAQDCDNRLQSYAPNANDPLAIPAGSTMSTIKMTGPSASRPTRRATKASDTVAPSSTSHAIV